MLIRRGQFEIGDEINIGGSLWRVLDVKAGAVFIWKHTGLLRHVVFNRDSSVEYEGSDLQKYAREIFPETVPEELVRLAGPEGFRPLTFHESESYMTTPYERIATDPGGNACEYWLMSVPSGAVNCAWSVCESGAINASPTEYMNCFAPVCWLRVDR